MKTLTRTTDKPRRNKSGTSDTARWTAVLARDANCDHDFYYAVTSTGIYCRPSCPARRPKRENVRFFATAAEAEAHGFRACARCKPEQAACAQVQAAKVAQACRAIETSEDAPNLAALAAEAGLSPHHFHRIFKAITGVTPKAYATAQRHKRLRETLANSRTVTEAVHASGFNASSRFYAQSTDALGMQPATFRKGGAGETIRFATAASALGTVLVAATDKGLCAILLGDDAGALQKDLETRFARARISGPDAGFKKILLAVVRLIAEPTCALELPLDVRGTAFQHRVWTALRQIPPGTTASYAEIARRIGKPKSVRAVAGACAANPLALVIPCHRVVASDGALSGYRWGVARKRALLSQEAKPRARSKSS
jgi:AraC family transcriptional regulator, regulatory protein of adaptative response / methylated-DNA-[protein]-cysteine methyltransferase